jgi:hypothetical protein
MAEDALTTATTSDFYSSLADSFVKQGRYIHSELASQPDGKHEADDQEKKEGK